MQKRLLLPPTTLFKGSNKPNKNNLMNWKKRNEILTMRQSARMGAWTSSTNPNPNPNPNPNSNYLREKEKLKTSSDWLHFMETNHLLSSFRDMKRAGLTPDSRHFSKLFLGLPYQSMILHRACFAAWQRKTEAKKRFAAAWQKKTIRSAHEPSHDLLSNQSFQSLLYALLISTPNWKKEDEFKIVWRDYCSTNLEPCQDTLAAFLEAFSSVADGEMVEKIHDLLARQKKKSSWQEYIYIELLKAHGILKNDRAVKRLFEEYDSIYPLGRVVPLYYYLEALFQTGAHREIEIYSKRVLRHKIDLDRNCYRVLLKSFVAKGDLESLSKWEKVLSKHFQWDQELPFMIYYDLLDSYASLESVTDCQRVFKELLLVRGIQVQRQNSTIGLSLSPLAMGQLFENFIRDQLLPEEKVKIDRFREWNNPLPSRKLLCIMAEMMGKKRDSSQIYSLFDQFLSSEALYFYWAKEASFQKRKLIHLLQLTQKQLDELNGKQDSKTRNELKTTISWVNRRLKRGISLKVGESGPFAMAYKALIDSWRASTVFIQDPLELEGLLEKLESLERARFQSTALVDLLSSMEHSTDPQEDLDLDSLNESL